MGTVIERLEALAEHNIRATIKPYDGDVEVEELLEAFDALPALLNLARAVGKANPQRDPRHRVSMLANDWQAIVTAAEPLFREDPS